MFKLKSLRSSKMSQLKATKQANQHTQLTVFGYIREHEQYESINIPSLIAYQCLAYYYVHEFIANARKDIFQISNDKLTVHHTYNESYWAQHTIYCNLSIASKSKIIAKWTFVIGNSRFNSFYFGLVSNYNKQSINEDFCQMKNKPYYCIGVNGRKFAHTGSKSKVIEEAVWSSGDIVTITVDFTKDNATFTLNINERMNALIFDHIETGNDIKYKLVLQMDLGSATLKNYQEYYA
eukprot:317667_1